MSEGEAEIALIEAVVEIGMGSRKCAEKIHTIMCSYFFPPCVNTSSHLQPMPLCEGYCKLVTDVDCNSEWRTVLQLLNRTANIYNASNPFEFLETLDFPDFVCAGMPSIHPSGYSYTNASCVNESNVTQDEDTGW